MHHQCCGREIRVKNRHCLDVKVHINERVMIEDMDMTNNRQGRIFVEVHVKRADAQCRRFEQNAF